MKKIGMFLAAFVLVSVVILGSAYVYAQGAETSCQDAFKQFDSSNKGYLSQSDFASWYDTQSSHHTGMGLAPIGGAESSFMSADTNNDSHLTMEEFCAWVNSQPPSTP